jgi:tetratricopeptide (TPR) repeat protein
LEKARGPQHPEVAYAHANMAEVLRMRGDYASALEHAGKALAIWEGAPGTNQSLIAVAHETLGAVLVEQGKMKEALAQLERAEEIRSRPGSDPSELRTTDRWMGLAYFGLGDARKGLFHLERSLKLSADDPLSAADARFDLAKVMRRSRGGDAARARAMAQKARDEYRTMGIQHDAARVEQWLAANQP